MIESNNMNNYKNITLISNTNIVIKIFTLVCDKLLVNLTVLHDDENLTNTDILIYEDSQYNKTNTIKYKTFSKALVVIANERTYEYESCYLIKKPFLPSELIGNITEIIESLKSKDIKVVEEEVQPEPEIQTNDILHNIDSTREHLSENIEDLVDFIDSIDSIDDENTIEDSYDDLIIDKDELGHGGVLDKKELDILHDMISSPKEAASINKEEFNDMVNDNHEDDTSDWIELSDIIDKAIDDVQDNVPNNEFELVLNNYTMEELSPLLDKLDQSTIDLLSAGEEILIKLKLEVKDD